MLKVSFCTQDQQLSFYCLYIKLQAIAIVLLEKLGLFSTAVFLKYASPSCISPSAFLVQSLAEVFLSPHKPPPPQLYMAVTKIY